MHLQQLHFSTDDGGRTCTRTPLDGDQLTHMRTMRDELIDTVSAFDDLLADHIISSGSMADVTGAQIERAIRLATVGQHIVPLLLGSAYRNCGVQPLVDAVVSYLPAPSERNAVFDCFGAGELAGRVFKVTHDKQRGPLCLVRMMRGKLRRGAKVVTSQGQAEHVQRLYEPLADEYREVGQVEEGDVAIVAGLRGACTGDLLVASASSLRGAQKRLRKSTAAKRRPGDAPPLPAFVEDSADEADTETGELDSVAAALGLRPRIPDAVYFCSVEPPSQSQQLALETALRQMQREDPSLRVRYDESTAQTVLGGMGELHLDIVRSRLQTEYRIEAELGPLQIAYKETLVAAEGDGAANRLSVHVEKEIAGTKQLVTIELSLVTGAEEQFR